MKPAHQQGAQAADDQCRNAKRGAAQPICQLAGSQAARTAHTYDGNGRQAGSLRLPAWRRQSGQPRTPGIQAHIAYSSHMWPT